MNIIHTDFR